MTAMNLIVQERAKSAFLLTDTGYFNRVTGAIEAFGPKVHGIAIGGGAYAAIATSGSIFTGHIRRPLSRICASTLEDFLVAMPGVFRAAEAASRAEGGCGSSAAAIVAFDPKSGRALGWGIRNDTQLFRATPYTLVPTRKSLTAFDEVRHFRLAETDFCDPRQWNPITQGVELVEAQRQDIDMMVGGGASVVGGEAVLTCVTREGISHVTLKSWPDRVGKRIDLQKGDRLGVYDRVIAWNRQTFRPIKTIRLSATNNC